MSARRARCSLLPAATVVIVLAGLLASGCGRTRPSDAALAPPRNVLILCLDTLRRDRVGSYGGLRDTTPNLDALADRGARFEDAIANSNWTVPATASLLTSRFHGGHGAGITGEVRHLDRVAARGIRKDVPTLSSMLDERGFRTGLFSANPYLYGRFREGFDHSVVERIPADELTNHAIDWLDQPGANDGQPFFLYLQYIDLHQPIAPPEPYRSRYVGQDVQPPDERHVNWQYGQLEDPDASAFQDYRRTKLALYDGALRFVDFQVGRLLQRLDEMGFLENTLVIFTADHGEEFWDHAEIGRELGGDPRNLWGIGHGHTMFAELLDVPMVIAGPDIGSAVLSCPAMQVDVVPTVLAQLGIDVGSLADSFRGRDLSALLRDPENAPCAARPLPSGSPAYGPDSESVIFRGRKLITRSDGRNLLFDLRRDPHEHEDLSEERPEEVEALRRLIRELGESEPLQDESGPEGIESYDEKTRKQLEALGYIG